MAERPFVHLHCHTHYSLLDGASRVPELVEHVRQLGMNACAITDHGNLFGAVEFYLACRAAGLNPIIGYEAYVAPARRTDREAKKRGDAGFHLTLLARNAAGLKNLIKMASAAYLEGYYYVPRIDKELLEAHHDGLICLSGCASSEFSEFILRGQLDEARRLCEYFARLFGKDFYVEVQNNGIEVQRLCAQGATDIADKLGLPLVATSDAHYLTREDAPAHDVLLCINTGKTLNDPNRLRYGNGDGPWSISSTSAAPRRCTGAFRTARRRCGAARRSPTAWTSGSTSRPATSRCSRRHRPKSPTTTCASCASRACASATGKTRRRRPGTGWHTSWTSSAAWVTPATS
jgi:DNA polymerase III alpha subunit